MTQRVPIVIPPEGCHTCGKRHETSPVKITIKDPSYRKCGGYISVIGWSCGDTVCGTVVSTSDNAGNVFGPTEGERVYSTEHVYDLTRKGRVVVGEPLPLDEDEYEVLPRAEHHARFDKTFAAECLAIAEQL